VPQSSSLQQLQQDALLRADMVNSSFVTPQELTRYINQGITELYEQLCVASQDYYLSNVNIQTNSTTDTYALPADFFWLRGVDINLGGQQVCPARRFNWEERDIYKLQGTGWYWGQTFAYDLRGNTIVLFPAPQGIYGVVLWYYPIAPTLSAPDDTFDAVNGWDELITLSCAIKMLTREESWEAVDRLKQDYAEQMRRVQSMAPKRNAGQPPRITDLFRGTNPYRQRRF
jgi:hypothetical protein